MINENIIEQKDLKDKNQYKGYSMIHHRYCLLKDSSRMYVLCKRPVSASDNAEIMRSMIYTEPYKNRWSGDTRNEIVGYSNMSFCEEKRLSLCDEESINISESSVMYMKGVCSRLNMPLRVIATRYCDIETKEEHEDIYYYISRNDEGEYMKGWNDIIKDRR